jgi:hypothetical protein
VTEQQYFPELVIAGERVDLSHLEPFTFVIQSQLAKRDLRVHVTFSNHCFTQGYEYASHPARDPIIDAGSARPRTFCPIRYRLSQQLPALIKTLNHPKAKVWETSAERNWCYSITIDDPEGPYHVFFEVRRTSRERRQWQDINLIVESAYHEDDDGGPSLKGSMAFRLLCGKVYLSQPVATKR